MYALPPRLARLPARARPGGLVLHEAAGPRARLLGLAGLAGLPAAHGLWLPATRSVHTLGMRFPLDLLWLDGAGAPVRLDQHVGPARLRTCRRARSVIEVAAGAGGRWAAAHTMEG